jgi:DNA-binding XRE family transcriptional regulator
MLPELEARKEAATPASLGEQNIVAARIPRPLNRLPESDAKRPVWYVADFMSWSGLGRSVSEPVDPPAPSSLWTHLFLRQWIREPPDTWPTSSRRSCFTYSTVVEEYSTVWAAPEWLRLLRNPTPSATTPTRSVSVDELLRRSVQKGRGPALERARRRLGNRLAAGGLVTLREMRLRAGMSQVELAAKIGTSQSRIARLEAGKENVSLLTAKKLADALGVDLDNIAAVLS